MFQIFQGMSIGCEVTFTLVLYEKYVRPYYLLFQGFVKWPSFGWWVRKLYACQELFWPKSMIYHFLCFTLRNELNKKQSCVTLFSSETLKTNLYFQEYDRCSFFTKYFKTPRNVFLHFYSRWKVKVFLWFQILFECLWQVPFWREKKSGIHDRCC